MTADLAAALGKKDDEAYFKTMFENVRKDYNAKWFDASVGYYRENPSQPFLQAMQALPLGIGLVDQANRIPLETKLVQDVLVTRHGHEEVGIAGSRWIFPALSQAAHDGVPGRKAAYAMALQTTYPSTGTGSRRSAGPASANTGSPAAGREPTKCTVDRPVDVRRAGRHSGRQPGFKTINIRPLILNGAGIDSVSATYSSVHGPSLGLDPTPLASRSTSPSRPTPRPPIYVPGTIRPRSPIRRADIARAWCYGRGATPTL